MALEDETFSKFYRPVEELPASINMVEFDEDFDAIFGPQAPKYALQASLYTSGLTGPVSLLALRAISSSDSLQKWCSTSEPFDRRGTSRPPGTP